MDTLAAKAPNGTALIATGVRFSDTMLFVSLSDGREIGLPLSTRWLRWLAQATPDQRAAWRLEHGGWAIYWDALDDGLEVTHLLSDQPLV